MIKIKNKFKMMLNNKFKKKKSKEYKKNNFSNLEIDKKMLKKQLNFKILVKTNNQK